MHLIVLLFAGFASVFTIGKAALEVSDPLFFVGSRMTIAGIFMCLYSAYSQGLASLKLNRTQWIGIGALAVVNIYLTNALEFWGLKSLTSTKTCFFYSLTPFIAAIGSYLFFKERLSTKKWLGLIIGIVGFSPIIFGSADSEELRSFLIFSWPELAVLGAVVASSIGWILLKQSTQKHQVGAFAANGLSMLLGGAITTVNSLMVENWNPIPTTDITSFLLCSFALMTISNFLCYNLYAHLFTKFSATFISFSGFITPAFTALYGYVFLNEQIPLLFYPSYAMVSLGIFVFYMEELKVKVPATQEVLTSQEA